MLGRRLPLTVGVSVALRTAPVMLGIVATPLKVVAAGVAACSGAWLVLLTLTIFDGDACRGEAVLRRGAGVEPVPSRIGMAPLNTLGGGTLDVVLDWGK